MQRIAYGLAALLGIAIASPAMAANENVITQSKALAGNVTPGDTAGYPITINTPGAYVLGSGLDVTPGQWGIVVNANGVDIDMSGYTLSGNGNADYGIVSGYNDSRIHDGNISAFKASGMYLRGNAWSIESMKIQRNSGMGIDATGARFINVRNSLIGSNGLAGIVAGESAIVKDSAISSNGGRGILTGDSAIIKDSDISSNGGRGIECGIRCNVEGNTIAANSAIGVMLDTGSLVGNVITDNSSTGFFDSGSVDVGLADNIFQGNGIPQRSGGLDLNPNRCVASGC